MEAEGIVTRRHARHPVRIDYQLTDEGRDLESVIEELGSWAERWAERSGLSPGP